MNKESPTSTSQLVGAIIFFCIAAVTIYSQFSGDKKKSTSRSSTQSYDSVSNSAWDGSVRQVKRWIERNAKDPKSVEYIEWSPVVKQGTGYMVRVRYRAKNSFGGYVIEEAIFVLDANGSVISTSPTNR